VFIYLLGFRYIVWRRSPTNCCSGGIKMVGWDAKVARRR